MATASHSSPVPDEENLFLLSPSSNIHLSYLAEGAANIIYKPVIHPSSPIIPQPDPTLQPPAPPPPTELPPQKLDPQLQGKLIRLRKDLPTTSPVLASHTYFQSVIQPLFLETELINQTIFRISPLTISDLNLQLQTMETTNHRPLKRHGTYLSPTEPHGTLITDMSPTDSHLTLEFKPKWLAQSPSAPVNSTRCRTCALHAMRASHGEKTPNPSACPLLLTSGQKPDITRYVDSLLSSPQVPTLPPHLRTSLINYLHSTTLLQRLATLQTQLDPSGVWNTDLTSQDFRTAMTLRDCTLFLKIPRFFAAEEEEKDRVSIQARLGDLDLKSPAAGKIEVWRATERELAKGGWYTATAAAAEGERDISGGEGEYSKGCYLARRR